MEWGLGVIREANRAAAALFTCERPYLLGKPIAALLLELSGRQVRDLMARAFTTSGPASCWASTSPGRGSPRRIIITIEADISGESDDPRIRWAIQLKGTPDAARPLDEPAPRPPEAA